MNLNDTRKALVIGGTGGLGAVAARILADTGVQTWVTGRRARRTGGYHEIILPFEGSALFLRRLEEVEGLLDGLSYLVCAFGPYSRGSLESASGSDWIWMTDANLVLPGMMVSRVIGGMKKRKFGRIVFFGTAGSDSILGRKYSAAYQAAKTGLAVLAKSIAVEGAEFNVGACVLCPGYVRTEYTSDEEWAVAASRLHGRTAATPDDYSPILGILLSEEGSLYNGAVISLSQGL